LTLIKSISGIRGTIGGKPGDNLTPVDVVKFTAAFATYKKRKHKKGNPKIVIGRDGRISGDMVRNLVVGTLQGLGIHVVDLDLSTTPTVEIAVVEEKAIGGIILTASHNPKQWNALKLLNEKGEFISAKAGEEVLAIAEKEDFDFTEVTDLGSYTRKEGYFDIHIQKILNLPLVDVAAITAANFKIVIDCVNSTGGIVVPQLLRALGVKEIVELFCEPNGNFPHNPEPLAENLGELSQKVKRSKAHLGIAVDPDVDRLVLMCEDGNLFGEEYTLVAVADYVLKNKKGNTVSNLSSTRALKDITEKAGGQYSGAAVGEVNVVEKMKEVKAVIGGEGNGGVIYPDLHYGRDALVGIALFLSHLAKYGKNISMLRSTYPDYQIVKNKIELNNGNVDVDNVLKQIHDKYKNHPISTVDGVRIEFDDNWVHLRKSNTEPIIRVIAESTSETMAKNIANKILSDIKAITNGD
jgi:phosphomannomutase